MAERLTCCFSGRVQGVGFRYTTRQAASSFAVTGFVRNLSDGRVELVAEGERDEIEDLLARIRREMSGYISDAEAHWAQATDEFDSFGIRF